MFRIGVPQQQELRLTGCLWGPKKIRIILFDRGMKATGYRGNRVVVCCIEGYDYFASLKR
ncbi:hypothetical protein Ahy_A08g039680 isoform B [Arachis hypogaea]|uniref:Uncharacterized protein n=1 Tax=Arachis hypogaea TaxID=3818 RepID=A0A445BWZ1_ARAHY|nr:hypothetical protein Ahy_A08g039680 isoform B [Arachis hypogaea]